MFRSMLSRGVSAGVLTLALSSFAYAQQSLPTIDVGAARGKPQRSQQTTPSGQLANDGTSTANSVSPTSKEAFGGRFTGYGVTGPVGVAKTNIPILQTPFNVQVVQRETMDDRQVISIKDALLENVSSVSAGDLTYDTFMIRGFRNDYVGFLRNGLRQVVGSNLETANLQAIEVLKGPAAMIYGRVEPGGVINLVPKRPLNERYFSVQEQAGSFANTRTAVDATGPLTADKTLAYRFNLAYQNQNSFRDFVNKENVFLAPTVSWKPIERFTLNVDGEYQYSSWVSDEETLVIPAVGRKPADIPISRYLGDPTLTTRYRNRQERALFAYDWTYQFVDDWSITNHFSYSTARYGYMSPGPLGLNERTGELGRYLYYIPSGRREAIATNIDINGKVSTGPLTHKLLAGFDYYNYNQTYDNGNCCNGAFIRPINIYAPIYSGFGLSPYPPNFFYAEKDQWKGLYAQDQISFWGDRVHVLLGGRHDWAESSNGFSRLGLAVADFSRGIAPTSANSPRVGILLQPFPWLSFYGNYTRSYGSPNGISRQNTPLPAQSATQYEGGVKAEFFDKRLTATFAYFDIIKSNITRPVPGTPFVRPIGQAESKGVEFDLNGRIDDNWSVIATYSHIDVRFTKDEDSAGAGGLTGKRLAAVPRNAANLWIKYNALGAFRGLNLGGGVVYVDQRPGDDANTFELPAYARVDAFASYRFQPVGLPWAPNLTLQVNVKNLLGTTYYETSTTRFNIVPGAPRAFLASIRAEF